MPQSLTENLRGRDAEFTDLIVKSPWVDVRAFGASPSSPAAVNDAAFQNAINTANSNGAGLVVVPPGTYKTSVVLNHKGGVSIIGAGPNASIIQSTASRCMQADSTAPPGRSEISFIRLKGAESWPETIPQC